MALRPWEVRMSDNEAFLRPEANALPYEWLTSQQMNAFGLMARMLAQAVPEGETKVRTRVLLLSGERGTGKTTVLLSLIKSTRNYAWSESRLSETRTSTKIPQEVQREFEKLRPDLAKISSPNVEWLETLELSSLPASAQLFSAILVRIEEAVSDKRFA